MIFWSIMMYSYIDANMWEECSVCIFRGNPEDADIPFLRDASMYLPNYMLSHHRRLIIL